ncbi:hypothetical protein ACGC1H_000985 [Rhizoctonia solani]
MSTYRYAAAPGYLAPGPAMSRPSTHEDMSSYSYRGRDDASVKSYHSRSSHVKATHSVDARPSYSYDTKSGATTFDSRSVYPPDARSVRSTDARPTYSVDARSTYSYEVRSVDARSTYSIDARSVRSTDERSVRSTGARSSRSKSRTRADHEPQQFLNVQPAPMGHRAASAAGSHRSRAAPSLTHSGPSIVSDDDNESDNGRPIEGLNTPYTAKVALWRDDVHVLCDDIPPETILPPHVKARYEYSRRQYGGSPSLNASDIPSIVVPSCTTPSRVPSPRSTFPPHLSTPPTPPAPNPDFGGIVEQIEDIEYEVNSRILEFTFPSTLDFGEKLPNGEFPPLPYTSRNKPLIEHRHYLEKSLLRMDEIHSFNDSGVKSARKRVVTKVQEQLEQLNRMEKMVRDNVSARSTQL